MGAPFTELEITGSEQFVLPMSRGLSSRETERTMKRMASAWLGSASIFQMSSLFGMKRFTFMSLGCGFFDYKEGEWAHYRLSAVLGQPVWDSGKS